MNPHDAQLESDRKKIVINIDGACPPANPRGVPIYAYIIRSDGAVLAKDSGLAGEPYTPDATNNVAEYKAVIKALGKAKELGLTDNQIKMKSDSQLLVNQLNGKSKVSSSRLVLLYGEARDLAAQFPNLTIEWIPRNENTEADILAKNEHSLWLAKQQKARSS